MIRLDTGWDERWRQVREGPGQWDGGPSTRRSGLPARRIQESPHGGRAFTVRLVADLDLRGTTGRTRAVLLDRDGHPLPDHLAAHPQPVPMGERQA